MVQNTAQAPKHIGERSYQTSCTKSLMGPSDKRDLAKEYLNANKRSASKFPESSNFKFNFNFKQVADSERSRT